MGIVAGRSERDCTGVFDSICVGVEARMQLWRNAEHKHPQKSGGNENSDRSMQGRADLHRYGVSAAYQNPQDYFFENPGGGSAFLSDLSPHR